MALQPTGLPSLPVYAVRVQGHLPPRLLSEFSGLRMAPLEDGSTQILVQVPDQSALYGLLDRLRDLNVKLISVNPISE